MVRMKIVLLSFTVMAFFACAWAQEEKREIVLGTQPCILSAPLLIAQENGYFKEEGLRIKIKEFPTANAAFKMMLEEGVLDMATADQPSVVFNGLENRNFVIIAGISLSDKELTMLCRKDRIKNAADLRGKKIGLPLASTSHVFLNYFLIHNELFASEVKTIDMDAAHLPQAIFNDQVDCIACGEPYIYEAKQLLSYNYLVLSKERIYREDFYIVLHRDFAINNPGTLRHFLKAVDKAEKFIARHKEEAIRIVSSRLKLNPNFIASTWDKFTFDLFLDQLILVALEDETHWAIKDGLTTEKEIPNYLDFIFTQALEDLEPKAVTIIR